MVKIIRTAQVHHSFTNVIFVTKQELAGITCILFNIGFYGNVSSNNQSKHMLSDSLSSNNHGAKSCLITHKSSRICSGQPKRISTYTADHTNILNDTLP